MRPRTLAALLALLFFAPPASAYLYQSVTVSDALTRTSAWVHDHPNRAEGYFFLGGVNGSAWANGATVNVPINSLGDANTAPSFVPWNSIMFQRKAGAEITPEALKYLAASIAAYRKAVELDAGHARYQLGLAWSLEEAASAKLKVTPDPAAVR